MLCGSKRTTVGKGSNGSHVRWKAIPQICPTVADYVSKNRYGAKAEPRITQHGKRRRKRGNGGRGGRGGEGRRGRELGDRSVCALFCNVVSKLYLKFRSMEVERVPNIGKLPLIKPDYFLNAYQAYRLNSFPLCIEKYI